MRPHLLLARFGSARRPPPPAGNGSEPVEGALIVSRDGDDDGAGTLESPWRTLAHATTQATPGDTIYLRGGYYDVVGTDTYLTGYPGTSLVFSGTEANPITVRSYPSEWAIIDGANGSLHPRYLNDEKAEGGDAFLLRFVGEWVNWADLEFRNSHGYGFGVTSRNCSYKNIVHQRNNQHAFYSQSRYCVFEDNISVDNYNLPSGGNAGNGFVNVTGSQIGNQWTGEVAGDCEWRRNISVANSDDGITAANTKNNLFEHNVTMLNGRGPSGDGNGYKMGLASTTETNNVFRFNIAYNNRANGFDTNTSQGVLAHNNTAFRDAAAGTGFVLTRISHDESDNTAHNNIVVGFNNRRTVGSLTTHTHNVGSPDPWRDTGGVNEIDNLGAFTTEELAMLSTDPTHANFAKLGESSLARGAGTAGTGFSTDLGAIPYGTEFAGGWDWQAKVAQYPTAGENLTTTEFVDGADREVMVLLPQA